MKNVKFASRIGVTIKRLTGTCPVCGRPFTYPRKRRLNTAYVDERRNFLFPAKSVMAGWKPSMKPSGMNIIITGSDRAATRPQGSKNRQNTGL